MQQKDGTKKEVDTKTKEQFKADCREGKTEIVSLDYQIYIQIIILKLFVKVVETTR